MIAAYDLATDANTGANLQPGADDNTVTAISKNGTTVTATLDRGGDEQATAITWTISAGGSTYTHTEPVEDNADATLAMAAGFAF